jgi:hypothetical protein
MLQENHENEYVDAEDANEDYDWELAQDEILECQEVEDFEKADEWYGDYGQFENDSYGEW